MEKSPDSQLVQAAKQDKTTFVELYDKYFDQIYKYIVSRTQDQQLAEDITSETFIKALESIDNYEDRGHPFSSWLYRIAINEINSHYRSKTKEQNTLTKVKLSGETKTEAADEAFKKEQDDLQLSETLTELKNSIHKLNKKEQEIITLKYFENLTYKDIAHILGISTNLVGVKLNRAVSRLTQLCNYIKE